MEYIALITALAISGISAWYSIVGLTALFAGAKLQIVIMGIVLELGKIVVSSWLYKNWKKANFVLKSYLLLSVIILMVITSTGIFGYLSKAHLEQSASTLGNDLKISLIDQKIERENKKIEDNNKVLGQLDSSIEKYIGNDRVSNAVRLRASQKTERKELTLSTDESSNIIQDLSNQKTALLQEEKKVELEVGPIKYVAKLIYSDDSQENLEKAVTILILMLVVVFDPLAIALIIAANMGFEQNSISQSSMAPIKIRKKPGPKPKIKPILDNSLIDDERRQSKESNEYNIKTYKINEILDKNKPKK
jgi:hypothetical protein